MDEAAAAHEHQRGHPDMLVDRARSRAMAAGDVGDLDALKCEKGTDPQHVADARRTRTDVQDAACRRLDAGAMGSIRKQIDIAVAPEAVWDALRDWGALHERLAPGFATAVRLEGSDRIVTFFTGAVLRERLVDRDDVARRLVWSIVDGPYAHHNGAAEVHGDGAGGSCLVWTTDLLPDEAAGPTAELMQRGIETIRRTLEAANVRRPTP